MSSADEQTPPAERGRLPYLDGLRGLAALYVTLHHAFLEVAGVPGWLDNRFFQATQWAWNGQIAVEVFIVLSGYSLMLPVARSGRLKGGWSGFAGRRARRILPPYYAALLLSGGVIWLVPGMNVPLPQPGRWEVALPVTWGSVVSHLLLLQDFSKEWIAKIDPPMWTIAQEWQIYFVFATVLLPLWRRLGILATVSFAALVSIALSTAHAHILAYASPEFLLLFALGMLAAAIGFPGSSKWLAAARDQVPWTALTSLAWAAYLFEWFAHPDQEDLLSLSFAVLAGCAILCTLVLCKHVSARRQRTHPLLRLLEAKLAVAMGTFSYSLYLVHFPVLSLCALALHPGQVSGRAAVLVEVLLATPVAVVVSYGFHLVFERPFMVGRPTTLERAEQAATLDTAP